ncbi:leucine-rich repeat-containing protein kinase family protein [Tardiphaga sp.]|uniref:leucine-rich repeat-containing protein kinase family protein n=1 Tax=Tardiphaga sp. TaxID=1926292 RepID=UPI002614AF12|nr:leucine-rich repeat-containing protein kinase family protein [Tardiphaga sp.]MDB5618530.1 protein kinase [Tardiphaga sp.]
MQTIEQLRSGELDGVRHLRLSCGLTEFPREIMALRDTLEVLDLSGNALSELPDDLAGLSKLRIIFCSENLFTELPEVLGSCPELTMVGFKANQIRRVSAKALPARLRWLVLTDNEIEELPREIGACTQLQKLMLAGNRLQALPESLVNCERLELLRLAANRLNELPEWLLTLPRLSWLACSGNPFGADIEADALSSAVIADVPWSALKIEHLLGQGASGIIHRARMNSGEDGVRAVAVKLFKGAMTSDGLPGSEMAASIGAGKHPNLIDVFGRVLGHPSGINGLVMQLVDPRFEILAGPPSLESCTRDVYPSSSAFDLPTVLQIADAMASAARHLHDRGIMHGDLYGHNILHDGQGQTLLGDFGAASFYDVGNPAMANGLQRLEVRAFGCLLEELVDWCAASEDDLAALKRLGDLVSACLSEAPKLRPLFHEISALLKEARAVTRTPAVASRGFHS